MLVQPIVVKKMYAEKDSVSRNDIIVYERLKRHYLPELRALYADCSWLKSTLAINVARELHPNEEKLLQFLCIVEEVIKEITFISEETSSKELLTLENRILRSILPVKARLHERWKQQILADKVESSNSSKVGADQCVMRDSSSHKNRKRKDSLGDAKVKSEIASNSKLDSRAKPTSKHEKRSTIKDQKVSPPNHGAVYNFPFDREESNLEFDEIIFDNISDCGVDLLDDHEVKLEGNISSSTSESLFSETMSPLQSRGNQIISVAVKKEKPPGPYYSSAVDIDFKSSFSNSIASLREEEYLSSRKRRKLNQIVPFPRKPRQAFYSCSFCNESYQFVANENPWWAVYKHECPQCKQIQIPRIDISQSSNAIELDPNVVALYGEGIDESDEDANESDDYTDDECEESNDDNQTVSMECSEDSFLLEANGLLAKTSASRLLVLMYHARTCSGKHPSPKHEKLCRITKFLMLHVRDCKGVDKSGNGCRFSWCHPCKRLLRHFTQCNQSAHCACCSRLNTVRLETFYDP